MASKIIGRTKCTECEFEAAHVKIKTDPPEGKTPLPYRHCPECGAQFFPRSQAQADKITARMRPEGQGSPLPAPEEEKAPGKPPEPPKPPQEPPAAPKPGKKGGWTL